MIECDGLTKSYDRGRVQALRGVSLRIESGEQVALMGPSGCGKSTLLNLLGALDRPDGGSISFQGRPLDDYRPFHVYRRQMVGFVFQFHHLIPALTLRENVALPLLPVRLKRGERSRRADALLEEMGLSDRADFRPGDVSGGERQRAAIARALINEPALVLADEPTGSLDSVTGLRVMRFLLDHARQRRASVLIATHNAAVAELTDRCHRMMDGRLESDDGLDSAVKR
ncbi:MAG: ABC transporter ATP-binding protein [Wenzhouxiangella sp.]|nr:MAG: ABC transporter ATP-binding protein [Wenzhouxiangella sp.]